MADDLTPEEHRLALALDAMEKARAVAASDCDWVRKAEIDDWFRRHAALIRQLRDKLEGEW